MDIGYGHWTLDHPPTIGSLVAIMTNLVLITTMIINMIIVMIIIITINILIIVIVVIIVGSQGPPISSQVTVLTALPTVGWAVVSRCRWGSMRIEMMMMM